MPLPLKFKLSPGRMLTRRLNRKPMSRSLFAPLQKSTPFALNSPASHGRIAVAFAMRKDYKLRVAPPSCAWHGSRAEMKRRTLRHLRAKLHPELHHNVYVVLLDPAVGKLRKVRAENPNRDSKKQCVYVGMTGLTPEERFDNHKAGIKDSPLVKRYGVRLLPELFSHLNPMPFEAAAQMEMDLAEDLRREGYTVTGGH